MERFFDRFLAPGFLPEAFLPPFPIEASGTEWYPTLDLSETADEFIVRLEAAGVHKENLDMNLTGMLLTITGRRELMAEASGSVADKLLRGAEVPVLVVRPKGKQVRPGSRRRESALAQTS
jgi:HSP20 family molecular chaperone IbpA